MSKIQVDSIVNKDDTGSPNFPKGATVTGVITATSFTGDVNGDAQGLSGTPNIIVGVTTASTVSASSSITVGDTFLQNTAVGLGTTDTTGRNAGVGTAKGTIIYNSTTSQVEVYDGTGWRGGLASPTGAIEATGGTIVDSGGVRTHIFTGTGAFAVSEAPPTATIDYLVVAGGGSGFGNANTGGGGGAGGVRTGSSYPVSVDNYVAIVGGAGALGAQGNHSELSVSGSPVIFADGGGHRGTDGGSGNGSGASGAGGGSTNNPSGGVAIVSPDGISPTAQGNNGGSGGGSPGRGSGGGGGAGGTGSNGTPSVGGDGGVGVPISWVPATYGTPGPNPGSYFGGGGGGGKDGPGGTGGAGGAGGGGKGQDATTDNATAGSANTGGGGGGGGGQTGVQSGSARAGGSGFIAVSYPHPAA